MIVAVSVHVLAIVSQWVIAALSCVRSFRSEVGACFGMRMILRGGEQFGHHHLMS